jgi:D-glycero-D-manno-heptose 1,7-bisphosphate phosphatase
LDGHIHLPLNGRLVNGRLAHSEDDREAESKRLASQPAVFLDRDGVLVKEIGYISNPRDLCLLPGVPEALKALHSRFYLIIITNQSGIARGFFTEDDLLEIHTHLVKILSNHGVVVDAIHYCPHHPEANIQQYQQICDCRKPGSGMLRHAERNWRLDLPRSFMVGDRASDMEAAKEVGVTGVFVADQLTRPPSAAAIFPDLAKAAPFILA